MAKGDHDSAMNQISQNRNTMNPQYQTSVNQTSRNYNNQTDTNTAMGQNQYGSLNSWQPSYSFAGSHNGNTGVNGGASIPPSGGQQQQTPFDMGAFQNSFMGQYGGKPVTADDIRGFMQQYPGASPINAKGDKWTLPNGQTVDLANSMGTGNGVGQFYVDNGGGGGGQYGFAPQMDTSFIQGAMDKSRPYFQNMADTGGYSPEEIQNIRARNLAPTTAMYSNAQDEMARHLALSNGQSPNYNAATAQMTRDLNNQIYNQNESTNAGIAQQVHQGKEFGAQGLSAIDNALLQAQMGGNQANLAAQLQGMQTQSQQEIASNQNQLEKMGLGNQLYGMNLGAAANTQNGYLQSLGQMGNYGLGSVQNQLGASQIPSNFQQGLGNIGGILGLGGQVAGAMSGLGGMSSGMGQGMNIPSIYNQMPFVGF